jgi:hypothetical protein
VEAAEADEGGRLGSAVFSLRAGLGLKVFMGQTPLGRGRYVG